ncbi:MAG: hypothetical protein N2595_05290 [bacterium]|nr:hypothetical protein [bacterium]
MSNKIACFVSPHGFGHAARTCAVLEALYDRVPGLRVDIFTTVPEWFFTDSLRFPFVYHPCECDIGMVQRSPLHEDVDATVARLGQFLPFASERIEKLGWTLRELGARAVLCDISALGIAAAQKAGVPSILIENFTWDWLYEGYVDEHPSMVMFARYLATLYAQVTVRIQTQPVCHAVAGAYSVGLISRRRRSSSAATRQALGVPAQDRMILLTMGGVSHPGVLGTYFSSLPNLTVVIPNNVPRIERHGGLVLLPWHSPIYHPDLVAAAEVVIGKLGYSTVAEVYHAGSALAWLHRPKFRESAAMATFVRTCMNQVELKESALADGTWVTAIEPLLGLPRRPPVTANGAAAAAEIIADVLRRTST